MTVSAPASGGVPVMWRITTRYDAVADRLALTGTLAEGSCRLWLTARLFRKLLPMLVKWLAEQGAQGAHADMLHRWAQESAAAALQPSPGVPAPAADSGCDWLAEAVTLQFESDRLVLIWVAAEAVQVAALPLQAHALRQWLHVLKQQCDQAGWMNLPWPAWLEVNVAAGSLQ